VLTPQQQQRFEEQGFLRLPGAVDGAVAAGLRERVRDFLAARRLVPAAPGPLFAVHAGKTAPLVKALGFGETWGPKLLEAVDDLLGPGAWQLPRHAGQLLAISFPNEGREWRLPHKSWHLDYPAPTSLRRSPGVQIFLCVDRVEPRGGATLVASGIHRLVDALRRRCEADWPGRSGQVRRLLQGEVPWLGALLSERAGEDRAARFLAESTLWNGVPLRVAPLTGEPGDVLAVHPWLLHAASPNCGTRPRLVLTERIWSSAWQPSPPHDGDA
jgi:hypothetical protein